MCVCVFVCVCVRVRSCSVPPLSGFPFIHGKLLWFPEAHNLRFALSSRGAQSKICFGCSEHTIYESLWCPEAHNLRFAACRAAQLTEYTEFTDKAISQNMRLLGLLNSHTTPYPCLVLIEIKVKHTQTHARTHTYAHTHTHTYTRTRTHKHARAC